MMKIAEVLIEVYEDSYSDIVSEADAMPEPVFSDAFLRKIGRLTRTADRRYVRISHFHIRRALASAIIVGILIAMTVTTIAIVKPEIRYRIIRMAREWELRFTQEGQQSEDCDFKYVRLSLPDGYKLQEEEKGHNNYNAIYESREGHFLIYTQDIADGTTLGIDTEGISWESIDTGDLEVMLGRSGGEDEAEEITAIMRDDYYVYTIYTNADENVAMKLLKQIQRKNKTP